MGWPEHVRYFSPEGDPALRDPDGTHLDERLMVLLDQARAEAGVPFHVTSGYRPQDRNQAAGGATDSAHLPDVQDIAYAVDGYFEGWPLLAQLLHVARYPFFGLGIYPYPPLGQDPAKPWPAVIHVDRKERGKPFNTKVLWVRRASGIYVYWPSVEFQAELKALARALA